MISSNPLIWILFIVVQYHSLQSLAFYALFLSAEVELKHTWRVCAGENSKEVDGQRNRNRREKETVYHKIQEIPPNPKEPWDLEMDYDDTLTPVIPAEQLPEGEGMETQIAPNHGASNGLTANQRESVGSVSTSKVGNLSAAEPDLELLAVLLKNPELVFALTSGQASNLSAADTVKLLDMIKAGGGGNASMGINKQAEEKVEVSLPSPTPPANPGTVRHFGLYANFVTATFSAAT